MAWKVAFAIGLIVLFASSSFPHTVVLLVRNGNSKNIRNWNDLSRKGISIIAPDPKTSGAARWNYLAAWGYALQR